MTTPSRSSLHSRAPSLGLAGLAGQPAAARCSAAEEQTLTQRLSACRLELLAIALLDPGAAGALAAIVADVEARKLRIGAVIDLHGGSREGALARLEALRLALTEQPSRADGPAALEAAFEEHLALARSTPLAWDGCERVLQHGWVRRRAPAGPALVPSWRRRVCALDREIDGIVRRLVAANQGLVGSVARRYRGLGLSREDLLQEGNIGLLRAIEKFDVGRGAPFGAYAVWWVRQAIRRALATQSRTIRIPVGALATRYTLGRTASRLGHELGREPTDQELARAAGVPVQTVADHFRCVREPISLDAPRSEDSSATVGDKVTDPDARSPNDDIVAKDSASHLRELLGGLSPREQLVLGRRFGLGGEDEQTLEEIGRSLDLTRERVRQIVAQALDRLQRKTRHAQLEL